jgi:hypothetical protein
MNYSECIKNPDFMSRFRYLKLGGVIGEETFGFNRWLNQEFYHSDAWRSFRRKIIIRDEGCDLACPGFEIGNKILIHHIEPITIADIKNNSPLVLDPENVICVSHRTHEAIHYGTEELLKGMFVVERRPGDTKLW